MCNEVPIRKRKKRESSYSDPGSDSNSETEANMDTSKLERKVDLDRKKSKIFRIDSDSDPASGTDARINSSKYERKVVLDTEDNVEEDKKEPKVLVVKVKEGMKKKQQTLPSMFFKPIKPSRNDSDVLLGETSPNRKLSSEVKESRSQLSGVQKDELIKCGKKEIVDKKKSTTKRKCVVRSEWFQSHEAIVDVNGDKVNTYLRRVPLNKYQVSCFSVIQGYSG